MMVGRQCLPWSRSFFAPAWMQSAASSGSMPEAVDAGGTGGSLQLLIGIVVRLQEQAAAAGGEVVTVLGNHEVLLLGAYHA